MKIERKIAEEINSVLEGYEEQIDDYANRNDQKNTRYVNGVRRGFCRALQMLDVAGLEVEVDQQPIVRNGMPVDCVTFDVDRASVEPDQRDWTEQEILNVLSIRCKELENYVETNRICAHKVLGAGTKKMMSGLMAKLGKIIYIPTEACMPILEAGRVTKAPILVIFPETSMPILEAGRVTKEK